MRIPVGPGWLGRVCNGRGEPIDGGPPVFGPATAPVSGAPLNPTLREPPAEPVLTGVSAIDALTTLVRGQKLPVFSVAGLPHLELATQIAAQASAGGEPFSVVFAAMGLTHADAAAVRDALEERAAAGELALLLNLADDPVIERILTPRIALTVAEHLAFALGRHVLVVMADMTSYCEALREVSTARGEIPARRAYPGYLYSDLASLYERCGRIRGRAGSVTVLPVLTMPAGDITHPVPDLTGYITEGQIVLSAEAHARGVYPPVDALSSLSRLMRKGVGPGRTRPETPGPGRPAARRPGPRQAGPRARRARRRQRPQRHRPRIPAPGAGLRGRAGQPATRRAPQPGRDLRAGLAGAVGAATARAHHAPGGGAGRPLPAPRRRRRAGGPAVSPGRPRVPPGRAGRLWLRGRLATAERGLDLLDRKLRILRREQERLRLLERRTGEELRRRCGDADRWLLRAALLGGQRGLRLGTAE